jgi:hypothetical protein
MPAVIMASARFIGGVHCVYASTQVSAAGAVSAMR